MYKKHFSRMALITSLLLIIIWSMMGIGTSLAWFADTDEETKNIFHFAEFDLSVEYRDENGVYRNLECATEVFDDEALYEPGYTQIVYLRVTNNGTVPFKFKSAVRVTDYNLPTNVFGQKFNLQEHLRFGLVSAKTEPELDELAKDRDTANEKATLPLNNYSTDTAILDAGKTVYIALIVRMPEEVDNVANYRGDTIPRVELGITVSATQVNNPNEP